MSKRKPNKLPPRFYRGPVLCHLVKRIRDGSKTIIVFKFWNVGYQRWVYQSETKEEFDGYFKAGTYAIKKPERFKNIKILFETPKEAEERLNYL